MLKLCRLCLLIGGEIGVVVHHLILILTGVDLCSQGCLRALIDHIVLEIIPVLITVSNLEPCGALDCPSASPVGLLLLVLLRLENRILPSFYSYRAISVGVALHVRNHLQSF